MARMGRPNSGYGIMNFLVLTPDGVGSTYLQRALTVYLNASGDDYYNTHELLNGLMLDDHKNLFKRMQGYRQPISKICMLLEINRAKIISRLAQYHVENRRSGKSIMNDPPKGLSVPIPKEFLERNMTEDYKPLYDTCHNIFGKIIYCTRDPFEYALSWGIRNRTQTLNVYNIRTRLETHGQDATYDIDLGYMKRKLDQYKRYLYWVTDNFPDAIEIKYEDIHNNIDLVLANLTGIDFDMRKDWGTSLQEYSTLLYKISLIYNPDLEYSDKLVDYQKVLIQQKKIFRSGMPIKMNTLEDKRKKVINFSSCLDMYNTWAESSNEFPKIWVDDISKKIAKENKIYELVD